MILQAENNVSKCCTYEFDLFPCNRIFSLKNTWVEKYAANYVFFFAMIGKFVLFFFQKCRLNQNSYIARNSSGHEIFAKRELESRRGRDEWVSLSQHDG